MRRTNERGMSEGEGNIGNHWGHFGNISKFAKCFLLKTPIKCFSKNHFKCFSRFLKVFFKICQTPYFYLKNT